MAAIHFNNIETSDFLNPILQREVDAFRMLVGDFKVTSIEVEFFYLIVYPFLIHIFLGGASTVEVRRADRMEVTSQMEQFGQAHIAKTFPLKLGEIVAFEKRKDYWEVRARGSVLYLGYLSL